MSKKEQQAEEQVKEELQDSAVENDTADATAESHEEQDPLAKAQAEINDWKNKYTRLYAEFDNFRKRTSKERIEMIKNAGKDVLVDLLPLIDDFDRAIKAGEESDDPQSVNEGFVLIQQKFYKALESKGVKPMNSIGEPFDVEFHEAITNIPAPSDDMKGKVVDVIEKGYFLNDQVLRYAKVVVGQ
ncbi:MAG: nucleotide exchange factor GrpE [Flavobacteriales bacterium]|nr:nucleotide exchange factor GrpE [Flavobacteriales bacterium]